LTVVGSILFGCPMRSDGSGTAPHGTASRCPTRGTRSALVEAMRIADEIKRLVEERRLRLS
jgi:hypothetical protein